MSLQAVGWQFDESASLRRMAIARRATQNIGARSLNTYKNFILK
jgi:hypothetical protein